MRTITHFISAQFVKSTPTNSISKSADISSLSSSFSIRPNKNLANLKSNNGKKSYAQAFLLNVKDIICIKDIFSTLPTEKVVKIINITNNKMDSKKPKINIMTKRPSRKQIIILMNKSNTKTIINLASTYINNINRCLKKIKSNTTADFICKVNDIIITTTNKATVVSNIEKYLKNNNNNNLDSIIYKNSWTSIYSGTNQLSHHS